MVAVLTVFANHLWGWPRGGFVGVDVFFVISGFLITGNLLRAAEVTGTVSFKTFYWNRVRRIVPAATVVLILAYVASTLVFLPFRSHQIGVDALFALLFAANWHFAIQGTDYFNPAADTVSPIQHYWSLSIEEQFYFVWPALILVISVLVIRKGWTHSRRMQLASGVMGAIVAASLAWATHETTASPTWAYFDTFSRVWELGVGALLATMVGALARIPQPLKPALSWAGLSLIGASLFLIGEGSADFPAPWALLPVAGAALVIVAGVGGEPRFQGFLGNPVSGYIGDVSYSLYLVHWPVIVLVGALVDRGAAFSVAVIALSFALTIASYHFIENPLRRADWGTFRAFIHESRRGRYRPAKANGYAAAGALTLLVVASCAYIARPAAYVHATPPPIAVSAANSSTGSETAMPPLAAALQVEIVKALKDMEWPQLDPSMEATFDGPVAPDEVHSCGTADIPDPDSCTWGSPIARTRAVLVGNSIAMVYSGPLREVALNSDGQFQLRTEAMAGCLFVDALITNNDQIVNGSCPTRKQHAIDVIVETKPDVVIISNSYGENTVLGSGQKMSPEDWGKSMRAIIDKFRESTKKIVFLAPPPADKEIRDCFGKRSSTPPDCVSRVTDVWQKTARAERDVAESIGATWVDSRRWFCNPGSYCPSFVGSVPTKYDRVHMSPAYGHKIFPVMAETLRQDGVF